MTSEIQRARTHDWYEQTWYQGKGQSTTEQEGQLHGNPQTQERKHIPDLEVGRIRDSETEREEKQRKW